MSLNFSVNFGNKTEFWDLEKLNKRLTDLKDAKKDVVWIRSDLSAKKSTGIGRFFWSIVGKRFNWLRKAFYKVDLEQSKNALNELQGQVKAINDKDLTRLFNEAVLNFNSIAPHHKASSTEKNVIFSVDVRTKTYKKQFPSMEIIEKYQKELEVGADINKLLTKAFKNQNPAMAAWLLKRGADIDVLAAENKRESDLLNWLKLQIAEVPATPENIDHYALTLGGGYKYANLKIMEAKAEKMSQQLKSSKVAVPPFLSLSDFEMTHALQQSVPEVFTLWSEFLDSFDPTMKQTFMEMHTDKEAAKVPVKISKKGEKILEQIKTKITEFYTEDPYFSLQMKEWLEEEKPQFLIVRSTGKEDSDTNSNAGGNESVPFITSKPLDISEAIGTVVASYFGEKSITQRLAAGDRSLFEDEKPFVPVLLQVMVGENVAGKGSQNEDVPRCGVLFTRQSDKAKGVTFIQTGLGNNEGVVSSQVGVDSYFVKDGKIHAVVRNKDTRFVSIQEPTGKYKVAPIQNNNKALEMSQALPNPVILDMKRVADDISESYASEKGQVKPMDMEYVVKLRGSGQDKPVIYLLQARPLLDTQDKEGIEHTYLDLGSMKDLPSTDKLTAETLLDGNAYVRKIEDPSEIIFVDDLPRGLDAYLKAKDPSKIKAIVSRKTAPATSHEAVTLRPKGVAVMVVNDSGKFKELKQMAQTATKENPLLADTQRGMFVKTPNGKTPEEMIKKGLVSYPIPLEVTVPPSRLLNIPPEHQHLTEGILYLFNKECDHLIEDLLNGQKPLATKKQNPSFLQGLWNIITWKKEEQIYNLRELFDIMATGEKEDAKRALGTVLRIMRARLVKSMKETDDFRKDINQPMFQVFEAAVDLAKKELIPAFDNYNPQSLERLYHLKFLEAMIFQTPGSNVMGASSYAQVLTTDVTQQKAMKIAAQEGINVKNSDGQKMLVLLKMSDISFSEDCEANWKHFIKDLNALPEFEKSQAIDDLLRTIIDMNKIGMTSIWMNKVFQDKWKKVSQSHGPGPNRARVIIKELKAVQNSNKETIAWIAKNLSKLEARDQQISAWNDPVFAQKNAKKLIASFKGELGFDPAGTGPNSIKAMYDKSDELGRLALMQYMRQGVDIYDRTIKTVKGSTAFKDDKEKARAVGELLKGYFEMMQATFKLVPSIQEQRDMMGDSYGSSLTFDEYVYKLKNGEKYDFGFHQVHGSIGFDNLIHYLNTRQFKNKLNFNTYGGNRGLIESEGLIEFEEMFPTYEPEYTQQFTSQLEARKKFSVDSMVIGSKADYNFSVHWPNRLEEYFTTFHQNMEQVIKYLNTKNGMDTSLLSQKAKEVSDTITKEFGISISSLGIEDDKIVVGYQIPLRQHSGSLVMKYNPKKPENGFELEVQMFGNDEQRRWDKGAAIGVLLAYLKGAGFTDDAPPEIEYHPMPTGVKFSLHLDQNSTADDQTAIISTLEHLMKRLTMDNDMNPGQIIERLEKGLQYNGWGSSYNYKGLGKIDWDKIPDEGYSHTLWMNYHLLNKFRSENEDDLVATVAIYSLLGIARRKLTDYKREHDNSLKTKSVEELKRLVMKDKEFYGFLVAELLEDPDVKEHLKDVCKELS